MSKSNLENNLNIFKIVILNTKWKDCKYRKNWCTKNFTDTKIFLRTRNCRRRFYLLKNAKKTCKPNKKKTELILV